jgi:taurine dioxygenase
MSLDINMHIITDNHMDHDIPGMLWEHEIVVLRGLAVDIPTLITIGELFGSILENKSGSADVNFAVDPDAKLLRVSNLKKDDAPAGLFGHNDLEWHNDFAHSPGEFHGTLLYNESGGDLAETIFSDTRTAYQDLDHSTRTMLDGAMGYHRVTEKAYRRTLTKAEQRLLRITGWKPNNAEYSLACVHDDDTARPMAPVHPVTGTRAIYLGPATYVGSNPVMDQNDYDALIKHCELDQYIYSHRWQPGDVVIFDNLSTMHRRGAFEGDRTLWRMQFNYDKHLAR